MDGCIDIQWKQDTELVIVNQYDEDTDSVDDEYESFKEGDIDTVDILSDDGDTVDIQFGDGSVAFGVSKGAFDNLGES